MKIQERPQRWRYSHANERVLETRAGYLIVPYGRLAYLVSASRSLRQQNVSLLKPVCVELSRSEVHGLHIGDIDTRPCDVCGAHVRPHVITNCPCWRPLSPQADVGDVR